MEILAHIHSVLRYVALLLLLLAIAQGFSGWFGKKTYMPRNRKVALFTVISVHTQLLIGLILYFWGKFYAVFSVEGGMKIPTLRFFGLEHMAGMLVAIIIITIGNARAKRASTSEAKFKQIAIWFTIGLVIILAMIPWPFMEKFKMLGWY